MWPLRPKPTTISSRANLSPRSHDTGASSPQKLVPTEDRAGEKSAFASEAYNQVARAAKLQAIMLTSSKFLLRPEFLASGGAKGGQTNLSYGSTVHNISFNKEEGAASCDWKWSVTGTNKRKRTLSVEAVYIVIYDNLGGCEPEAVERFLRRVARFASYPYFRAHVSQISWESGANLPILPTIAT